jgi:hypothetical protein
MFLNGAWSFEGLEDQTLSRHGSKGPSRDRHVDKCSQVKVGVMWVVLGLGQGPHMGWVFVMLALQFQGVCLQLVAQGCFTWSFRQKRASTLR